MYIPQCGQEAKYSAQIKEELNMAKKSSTVLKSRKSSLWTRSQLQCSNQRRAQYGQEVKNGAKI